VNADPAIRQAPAAGNRLDVAIEWASGATAVGMFAYGYALSYSVLYSIAVAVGLPPWAARVWPLGFESFMASAALNALAEQRHRRHLPEWWQRVAWYPWTLTALTAGGSLLLNWFHPAIPLDPPPDWLRSLVYGLPPLAAVFAWHLFLQRVTHRHHPARPDTCLDTLASPVDTTVQRLDTPPGPDTPGPAVDGQGVRALSASDAPPLHPLAPDSPPARPVDTRAGGPVDTRAGGPVDTPASEGSEPSDVDAPEVQPVDPPDEPDPSPSRGGLDMDAPGVQAADGPVDTPGVQAGTVSTPPAGGARHRLAASYAAGRPDGAAWTARTLAAAAGCGRSTAAAFLRQQRQAQQDGRGWGGDADR
jgi:hypothetical protein